MVPEAIRSGEIIYAADVSLHPQYANSNPATRSELVIPLRTAQGVTGVMDLQSTQAHAFDEKDQRLLMIFAEHAAAALQIVKLYEALNQRAAELEWRVGLRTRELQHSKEQVETILNSVADVIVLLDSEGHIVQTNPAFSQCYGYEGDAFMMKNFADERLFVTPDRVSGLVNTVLASGVARRQELKCRHKNGHLFDVEAVVALIAAEDHERQLVCSVRDISRQKALEIGLREALEKEKELGELKARFISMVSHEFRTPLAAIYALTGILHNYSDQLDVDERAERLLAIKSQVKHLTQLTDDVLTMSRGETVGFSYHPEMVDLVVFCQEIIRETESAFEMPHEIHFAHDDHCDQVFADAKLIGFILRNLLTNAIKYSPVGQMIEINLQYAAQELQLRVKDQGIGIPEHDQRHLFEVFHRAANVGTISGTGLGLAIVKQAVDAHRGRIRFSSIEGQGTDFVVTLPLEAVGKAT